jgi:hypothetical protein
VSVFRVIPTARDKSTRSRKINLARGFANPDSSLVRELAEQYFQPRIAAALSNPLTSLMQLHHLVESTPALSHLSDFVAICVIFVYSNPKTCRQAIAFLADPVVQRFAFDDVELDYLMRALFQRPPTLPSDVKTCGEVIAHFCGSAENCRQIFLDELQPGHFEEESREVLTAAANAILESGAGFSPAAVAEVRNFVESKRAGRINAVEAPDSQKDVVSIQPGGRSRTYWLGAVAVIIVAVIVWFFFFK